MSTLVKKSRTPRVPKEEAIAHLSQKFNIPESAMSATFEKDKPGFKQGRPHFADNFMITLQQPTDRPNLHHDMHQELTAVFNAYYRLGVPFYYGVVEDKEFRAARLAEAKQETHPKADMG